MRKVMAVLLLVAMSLVSQPQQVFADNTAVHGDISGKTVVGGLASLIIWPGLGQYLNENETKKNWTHAIAGLFPPFRLWSGWDALIDRQGGRWDGKI